jgi:hypothetical protein
MSHLCKCKRKTKRRRRSRPTTPLKQSTPKDHGTLSRLLVNGKDRARSKPTPGTNEKSTQTESQTQSTKSTQTPVKRRHSYKI